MSLSCNDLCEVCTSVYLHFVIVWILYVQVTVDLPIMSLMLTFSASHQFTIPTVTNATCSDIQNNIQYYCTAEFSVDIIPSVEIIQSVTVTVSGPYGSSSSAMEVEQSMHYELQLYYY